MYQQSIANDFGGPSRHPPAEHLRIKIGRVLSLIQFCNQRCHLLINFVQVNRYCLQPAQTTREDRGGQRRAKMAGPFPRELELLRNLSTTTTQITNQALEASCHSALTTRMAVLYGRYSFPVKHCIQKICLLHHRVGHRRSSSVTKIKHRSTNPLERQDALPIVYYRK